MEEQGLGAYTLELAKDKLGSCQGTSSKFHIPKALFSTTYRYYGNLKFSSLKATQQSPESSACTAWLAGQDCQIGKGEEHSEGRLAEEPRSLGPEINRAPKKPHEHKDPTKQARAPHTS